MKRLLGQGVSANAKNAKGSTALWAASKNGDVPVMQLLLDAGADPNSSHAARHESALEAAVMSLNVNAVRLLLERGANVNAPNGTGNNPTFVASVLNQYDIMFVLIEAGGDPIAKNRFGDSAVDHLLNPSYDRASQVEPWRQRVIERLLQRGAISDARAKELR